MGVEVTKSEKIEHMRLFDYLVEQGYIYNCINGGIYYSPPPKKCPLVINNKCVCEMTLDEFKAWEAKQL